MKNKDYNSLITTSNNDNIGQALQDLIQDNIARIDTSFLAKIVSINNNKVSISPIIKRKTTDTTTVYNNCLIGFNKSGNWATQFKLKKGDIGLAIVVQDDITSYKNNGKGGLNTTGRIQDKNDSIFIPFSLFDTLSNDDINYLIKSFDEKCKLEFSNENLGTLQAEEVNIKTENDLVNINLLKTGVLQFEATLLSLKSENTTLKNKLVELANFLDSAMIIQTPSGIQPFDNPTRTNFSNWKNSLDDLFQE